MHNYITTTATRLLTAALALAFMLPAVANVERILFAGYDDRTGNL